MTWLRVSSSGGIADTASVSVNAIDLEDGALFRGKRYRSLSEVAMQDTIDALREGEEE